MAIYHPEAFTEDMMEGEIRRFHSCDDLAHYCGIVADHQASIEVWAMSTGAPEPDVLDWSRRWAKAMQTELIEEAKALDTIGNGRVVRATSGWALPIAQRKYRAWFAHSEKSGLYWYDIPINPREFCLSKLSAEVLWAYKEPVYNALLYDGKKVEGDFVGADGWNNLEWRVEEMDYTALLSEEAKLRRLGLLKEIRRNSFLDEYYESDPIEEGEPEAVGGASYA